MASGQVRRLHAQHGRPVHVVGFNMRPQWSEVFEGNPKIAKVRTGDCVILKNGGGCRPYIQAKTVRRWYFKEWDIAPGEIFLSDAEREFAEPYRGKILIEPTTKVPNGNKAWIWERWQQVAGNRDDFIQVGGASATRLDGVDSVVTTFREAMAVLSVCRAYVGSEGALHHVAAAFDVPAVVLWSEFVHPKFTGYASQRNLRHAEGYCGSRLPCAGCKASMEAIAVDEVLTNLGEVLDSAPRRLAA